MKSEKNKKIMQFSQINTCLQNNLLDKLDTSEVEPMEMYRDIFSTMELETKGQQEQGKYNLICIQIGYDKDNNKKGVRRFFIHNGLKELDTLIRSKTNDFCMLSCISYAGLQNNHNNARYMYALVLDLDDIKLGNEKELNGLELIDKICGKNKTSPIPNYIVSSGHGLHLYFLFDKPVAMYKKSQDLLFDLKKELVKKFWNKYISASPEQHGNIIQGFRIAGTKTKDKKHIVKCFKVSDTKKYTPYELVNYTKIENKKDYTTMTKKSNYTLEQCKKKFPEWYEKRIIKKLPKNKWHIKRDLYDWFKRKVLEKNVDVVGHRYYCCMCLVVYAIKCDIDYNELKKDLYELQPILDKKGAENQHFTVQDIKDALSVYKDSINIFTRARMELLSGIDMPPNKRNGRTQKIHLEICRATQKIIDPQGNFRKLKSQKYKNEIFDFINKTYNEFLETEKENDKIKIKDVMQGCNVSNKTAIKYMKMWATENENKVIK